MPYSAGNTAATSTTAATASAATTLSARRLPDGACQSGDDSVANDSPEGDCFFQSTSLESEVRREEWQHLAREALVDVIDVIAAVRLGRVCDAVARENLVERAHGALDRLIFVAGVDRDRRVSAQVRYVLVHHRERRVCDPTCDDVRRDRAVGERQVDVQRRVLRVRG